MRGPETERSRIRYRILPENNNNMRLKHGALKTWFKSPDLLCLYEGLTLKYKIKK